MRKQVVIALAHPIQGHDGPIHSVTLKEPLAADFFVLGDPEAVIVHQSGTMMPQIDSDTVSAYLKKCLDCDPVLAGQMHLADAVRVRNALLDFFRGAGQGTSIPKPAPMGSFSSSDSMPGQSGA